MILQCIAADSASMADVILPEAIGLNAIERIEIKCFVEV